MKKTKINYILTDNSLVFIYNHQPYTLDASHQGFRNAIRAVREGNEKTLLRLFGLLDSLPQLTSGRVVRKGGDFYFNGKKLDHTLIKRIKRYFKERLNARPLILFLNKLYESPTLNDTVREQLFPFLEHNKLSINAKGNFLAYKYVRDDYWDQFTGKTHRNVVGAKIRMDRSKMSYTPENPCNGPGLHVGSYDYAHSGGARMMLVEVEPKWVVCVPSEYGWGKCVVEGYDVIEECQQRARVTANKEVYTKKDYRHNVRDIKTGRFAREVDVL